jgi:hypothetical protein
VIVLKKSNGRSCGNCFRTVSLVAISDDIRSYECEMLQAMDSTEELKNNKILLSVNKKAHTKI